MMKADLGYYIDEYMIYCRSNQLRAKTLASYEQALRLFERWCREELEINSISGITDSVIRRYINDLQERGKYTFYSDRYPTHRIFCDGKERICTCPQSAYYNTRCRSSSKCDYYEERD